MSCGINNKEGDVNEVVIYEKISGLLFIEVGEGGGEGFETETIILGASYDSASLVARVASNWHVIRKSNNELVLLLQSQAY